MMVKKRYVLAIVELTGFLGETEIEQVTLSELYITRHTESHGSTLQGHGV